MNQKTVTIEIDENGNCSIDLEGFNGSGCSKAASDFIGSDAVKKVTNKREFYQQQTSQKVQQVNK